MTTIRNLPELVARARVRAATLEAAARAAMDERARPGGSGPAGRILEAEAVVAADLLAELATYLEGLAA
jgi:plasmid stability protein